MNNTNSPDHIDHAANAIARLKASRAVQEAEIRGLISADEAADAVLKLNRDALDESKLALGMADHDRCQHSSEEQLEKPVA